MSGFGAAWKSPLQSKSSSQNSMAASQPDSIMAASAASSSFFIVVFPDAQPGPGYHFAREAKGPLRSARRLDAHPQKRGSGG